MGKKQSNKQMRDNDFILTSYQEDNEVTGSAFLLEIPREGLKILIDAGLFQSSAFDAKQVFDINKKRVKLKWNEFTHIIISHSH